jgi:hypothetical protein
MAIAKLYWLCREASSLGPSQTERCQTVSKGQMSRKLVAILRSAEHQQWRYFDTLNERSLDLSTDYEIIWFPDGETLAEKEKYMIQARKMMFTIT